MAIATSSAIFSLFVSVRATASASGRVLGDAADAAMCSPEGCDLSLPISVLRDSTNSNSSAVVLMGKKLAQQLVDQDGNFTHMHATLSSHLLSCTEPLETAAEPFLPKARPCLWRSRALAATAGSPWAWECGRCCTDGPFVRAFRRSPKGAKPRPLLEPPRCCTWR